MNVATGEVSWLMAAPPPPPPVARLLSGVQLANAEWLVAGALVVIAAQRCYYQSRT